MTAPGREAREAEFVEELDKAFDFHTNRTDDPYSTIESVRLSILEVRNAFARANKLPERKP